jgi:hypothetical protein
LDTRVFNRPWVDDEIANENTERWMEILREMSGWDAMSRVLEGKKVEDVAKELNLTVSGVSAKICHVRDRILRLLEVRIKGSWPDVYEIDADRIRVYLGIAEMKMGGRLVSLDG